MNKITTVFILSSALLICIGSISALSAATADAMQLRKKLEHGLSIAADSQIKQIKQHQGEFVASPKFIQKQRAARDTFAAKVLPLITQKDDMDRSVSLSKIEKLSGTQLTEIMHDAYNFLSLLPPLPAHVIAWSRTLTPFLSFSDADREGFSTLMNTWLTLLEEHQDDLQNIAAQASSPQATQRQFLNKLRPTYRAGQHNASQLLYSWVQASSALDEQNPLKAFLSQATTDAESLEARLQSLIQNAKEILKKESHGRKVSDADARGFVLFNMALLFAPDGVIEQVEMAKRARHS